MPKMSLKSSASTGMSTATRSTRYSSSVGTMSQTTSIFNSRGGGRSFGVTAQRSVNPWGNKQGTIGMREALNSAPPLILKDLQGPQCNHNHSNKMSTFEKIAMYTSLTAMAAQTVAGIVNMFTDNKTETKSVKSENNVQTQSEVTKSDVQKSKATQPTATQSTANMSFGDRLKGADSFSEINSVETDLGTKLAGIGGTGEGSYASVQANAKNDIKAALTNSEDAKEAAAGFALVNVNADAIADGIKLSDLSGLNVESSIKDIESSMENIDNDKKTLDAYKGTSGAIGKAKQEVSQGIQSRKGQLNKANVNLGAAQKVLDGLKPGDNGYDIALRNRNDAKAEVDKLNKEIAQLEDAKKALNNAEKQIDSLKDTLDVKKNELNEIKKTKEKLADKKYDLAKSQLDTLNNDGKKMKGLAKEINGLIGKADEKSINNLRNKINEYNSYVPKMSHAYTSLQSLGSEFKNITNAKGDKLTVPANLSSYEEYTVPMTQIPGNSETQKGIRPDAQKQAIDLNNQIRNAKEGDTVNIGGEDYTKQQDGKFVNSTGTKTISPANLSILNIALLVSKE